MYDIIIIGSGPAGSTLARELPENLKIAVIDKKSLYKKTNYENKEFEKCCGGLLAPDAQKILAKFGYGFPKEILVTPQIFSVETIDLKENFTRHYQRSYLNFDRHKFDLWLMSLIPESVDIFDNSSVQSIEKTNNYYTVNLKDNKLGKSITGKYLIGADGANSIVRKTFFDTPIRKYMSIQKSYISNSKTPHYVCFFDKTITDCYGWINVKNDLIQLGVALPFENAKENFKKIENIFIERGFDFTNSVKTEACFVNRPESINEIEIGKENIFLIGESAGFISPSSLEGISFAMESAYRLAISFKEKGYIYKNYKKNIKSLKFKIFLKILKTPFIYNPFLRKLVMKSKITSFDLYQ